MNILNVEEEEFTAISKSNMYYQRWKRSRQGTTFTLLLQRIMLNQKKF
jgi:hypothetical protein